MEGRRDRFDLLLVGNGKDEEDELGQKGRRGRKSVRKRETIEIPEGVSCIEVSGERLRLAESRGSGQILIEPLGAGREMRILMLGGDAWGASVNGRPVAPVALLTANDELSFAVADVIAHVLIYHTSRVSTISNEFIGQKCPVCTVQFTADTQVYHCACGAKMHCQGEEVAAEERLECARAASECPVCHAAIDLTSEGYSDFPEGVG